MAQLKGVRVLDLSRVLAAPLCAQMLGDLGAEVIKVERPGIGDEARYYGPPFFDEAGQGADLESALFLAANRNKKSITVDFSYPEGRDIIIALIKKCDVLIENYKVGTLANYGLDYASISELNDKLIYCSITGYGQTGPYASRPGYDAIFQAEGGLMQSIGHPDDQPGGGPMRVGLSIVDVGTSFYATIAILSALYARDARGGRGEHIDLSLLESCIGLMSHHAMHYLMSGTIPKRRGNSGTGGGVPTGKFECADGSIVFTIGNDAQFDKFCRHVLRRPELAADSRFRTNQARVSRREELSAIVADILKAERVEVWIERFVGADLAVSKVNDLHDVFAHPQVRHREVAIPLRHRTGRDLRVARNPVRFRHDPIETYTPPPAIGAHTTEVLRELLSMSEGQLAELAEKGVI